MEQAGMTDDDPSAGEPWLLANIKPNTVVIAMSEPGNAPRPYGQREYAAAEFPTFSYALQRFSEDSGIRLTDRACAISVCGAVTGEAVKITNGRWLLSPSGLRHLFGQNLLIVNNVCATLWATRTMADSQFASVPGKSGHQPLRLGARVMIWVDDGLGIACMKVDERGQTTVLSSEGGHITFSPRTAQEMALLDVIAGKRLPASYEQILGLAPGDLAWNAISPRPGSAEIEKLRAIFLGRFANAAAQMFAAWEGVYLCGSQLPLLSDSSLATLFLDAFHGDGPHRRMLMGTPCWIVGSDGMELNGAAAALSEKFRMNINA
jgi:glucokinase